jgi:hypothetical protein
MLSLKMQFNIKSGFCPKQNLFSFEKYAEVHMHMNDMMKFPNLKSGMLHLPGGPGCQRVGRGGRIPFRVEPVLGRGPNLARAGSVSPWPFLLFYFFFISFFLFLFLS